MAALVHAYADRYDYNHLAKASFPRLGVRGDGNTISECTTTSHADVANEIGGLEVLWHPTIDEVNMQWKVVHGYFLELSIMAKCYVWCISFR